MDYRREIDGLRAIAVLPVILYHAGFETFSGGFVGVDVFFVISGYLITTIILSELQQGNFSIVNFYERRARRIMPALFIVMGASLVTAYFTLMPDEFKNFGQSLVATSLFSNNILLAMTSGYWDLASEFKPLLHTWSLGVEEQYYLIFPVTLLLACKFNWQIPMFLALLCLGSFLFSIFFIQASPKWAFYILPTRAWEIAIGALAAVILAYNPKIKHNKNFSPLSFLGLVFIALSVFLFDKAISSPGWHLLAPTIGASLIILFGQDGSVTHRILGNPILVFIGLISYSLYLWHQPILAFLRAYSVEKPSQTAFSASIFCAFLLSCISWKYIERPFRSKYIINRRSVFILTTLGSIFFISIGLYLNKYYGLPGRVFDPSISIQDMDKRIYNKKVFSYKKNAFNGTKDKKILVIGNSFARDFINVTLETYDTANVEIIYRDDLRPCIFPYKNALSENLFHNADIIVFASGAYMACIEPDTTYASQEKKKIYYIGTKDFGYNLNWIIRLPQEERRNKYNKIPKRFISADREMASAIPKENYISLLAPTLVDNAIPITDDMGRMLSTDRAHLTKYGAIYFGQKAVKITAYSDLFK